MKFIVDAHLPYLFKNWLISKGHDAIHTLDLPGKNETEDLDIVSISESESRIVISKDSDFLNLHILNDQPKRLFLVTTGNIVNRDLMSLLEKNFDTISNHFVKGAKVIELSNDSVTVYE